MIPVCIVPGGGRAVVTVAVLVNVVVVVVVKGVDLVNSLSVASSG